MLGPNNQLPTLIPGLVSVIIPTYNRANLLAQAVESVRRQTYKNTQIIVVDDGSTDNTRNVVSKIPDVLYVYQENRRQAAARNTGLNHVRGQYICTLDSDDIWEPDFLSSCLTALETLKADFVFANSSFQNSAGERFPSVFESSHHWRDYSDTDIPGWRLMQPEAVRAMYLHKCVSPSSALLFRTESVLAHRWTEGLHIADDWCLILDIVLNNPTVVAFCMKPLWIKRVNGDNICDYIDKQEFLRKLFIEDAAVLAERYYNLLTPEERAAIAGRLAFYNFYMSVLLLLQGRLHPAKKNAVSGMHYVVETFGHSPGRFLKAIRPQ